jgi:cytochrome c biogenesis protein CcmG, thiol:disulfide interchange protein DsbE
MEVEGITQSQNGMVARSHKRRTTTFVAICILNIVLLVIFCTQLLTPAHNQNQAGVNTSSSGLGDISSPLIGRSAPDFTLPVLNGSLHPTGASIIHLAAFKGKPVILNFWASWCSPCNDEASFLQKAWPGLKAQGIVFIGIDGQERTSDALKFMHKYAISYPNVQDTLTSEVAADYGVTGFPETLFIDRSGIVVAKWDSPLDAHGLQLEMTKFTHGG